MQFAVQLPLDEHDRLPHAALPYPPVQFCVQLPLLQLSAPHAEPPLHVAEQFPVVHVMLPHACAPVHVTSHGLELH